MQIPVSNPQITPPSLAPKTSWRLAVKIIVGVMVAAITGTGILLAVRIWDPLWSPFRPEPEEVIEKMPIKMEEIKTGYFETALKIVGEETPSFRDYSISFKGYFDIEDPEQLRLDLDGEIELSFEGMKISGKGEFRSIGDASYVKFTELPFLMIDPEEIKGKWIELEEEPFSDADSSKQSKEKSEEMLSKIRKLIKEKGVYVVKEELPDEKIGEEKTYHYVIALKREGIKKAIPEYLEILKDYNYSPEAFLGPEVQREEILQDVDEFFDKVGEINIDFWIGKKDNYLYKVWVDKKIDLSKLADGEKGSINFSFSLVFSDFNKPVDITAPEDAVKLEDLMPELPMPTPSMPTPSMPTLPMPTPSMPTPSMPAYPESGGFRATVFQHLIEIFK